MGEFTHFNKEGNAIMVDVHAKDDTYRVAVAAGKIYVNEEVYAAIKGHTAKKGDIRYGSSTPFVVRSSMSTPI